MITPPADDHAQQRDRREVQQKGQIGDAAGLADDQVLRVAGDGGRRADVGGRRQADQVGNGIAPQPPRQVDHQRCEHQADRVIEEQRRQHPRREDHQRQQNARRACRLNHALADQLKEAADAQVGVNHHHRAEQQQRRQVDSCECCFLRNRADRDQHRRADQRDRRAIHLQARHTADRHTRIRHQHNHQRDGLLRCHLSRAPDVF